MSLLKSSNNDQTKPYKQPSAYNNLIIYLINLDFSPTRLEYMLPKIQALPFPFQRISAIDGKTLSKTEIEEKFDLRGYYKFMGKFEPIGAFGCSLSHIKTWETFLQSNYEFALILEDDVDFDPLILSETIQNLIRNKKFWDINTFDPANNKKGTPINIIKFQKNNLSLYLTKIINANAYLISRTAAKKLLEKALPIKMPIDLYLNRGWELGLIFTGISPRLASQKFGNSQIGSTPSITLAEGNISTIDYYLAPISAKFYKYNTALARLVYNLKLFCWVKLKLWKII
jgi:glycosyl transferase family 25